MPELFVFTIADAAPLRLALAPLAGAVNVTATPAMGFDEPALQASELVTDASADAHHWLSNVQPG